MNGFATKVFFDIPTGPRDFNWCVCGRERERDAELVNPISIMAEHGDPAAMSTTEAVEEAPTPAPKLDKSNEEDRTTMAEQKNDPASNEGAPAEDAADAAANPSKRKSHRPSLEVVEVTVDSFYDKAAFKQELQVGTAKSSWRID